MKTLTFSSLLLLSVSTAFGQEAPVAAEKAPAPVEDALRVRVRKFYEAFSAGKFKEAYLLVADDAQDKFFELKKAEYKSCEIGRISYSDQFTKAEVETNCKTEVNWRGTVMPVGSLLISNWKIVDGQWYWYYVPPTVVPNPFSPSGLMPVGPPASPDANSKVPTNIAAAAQGIVPKFAVDKSIVQLRSYENSQDVVHVQNDLPGDITLKLDNLQVPGLKITVGKTVLKAHEATTILFDWRLDDPSIRCLDCARTMNRRFSIQLRVEPFRRAYPITVNFEGRPAPLSSQQPSK
jgi:hypothetical protein